MLDTFKCEVFTPSKFEISLFQRLAKPITGALRLSSVLTFLGIEIEMHFLLVWFLNNENCRTWLKDNLRVINEKLLHSQKVAVCTAPIPCTSSKIRPPNGNWENKLGIWCFNKTPPLALQPTALFTKGILWQLYRMSGPVNMPVTIMRFGQLWTDLWGNI